MPLGLPPRLEYLMRIGLVDRSKLQQYKLAFKDPDNNVKFKHYREKILEVFYKIFDIVAEHDPIYEKVRQQVIVKYKYNLNRKKRRPMKEDIDLVEMDDETVRKTGEAHKSLLNSKVRGKNWAAKTVKALATHKKAIRDRDVRNASLKDNPNSRVGNSTNQKAHSDVINKLAARGDVKAKLRQSNQADKERWAKESSSRVQSILNNPKHAEDGAKIVNPPKPSVPTVRSPPAPGLNKPEADKKKVGAGRALADRVKRLLSKKVSR